MEVIVRSQNPGGGWRYQPQADGGEDTSCTMTVFHALASARQAGIVVPNETIAKVVGYLKNVHDAETGGFAYNYRGKMRFPCTAGGAYIAQACWPTGHRNGQCCDPQSQKPSSRHFHRGTILLLWPLLRNPGDGSGRR